MLKAEPKTNYRFFTAANGYTGFRSYFDSTFSPTEYTRIFVLKGGPGTGKSTLLRNIAAALEDVCDKCELILCSSDPHSLDGIILQHGKCRIGILDGTAPHERDAILPGAVSELVNLGDGWDAEELVKHRKEIEELDKIRINYYRSAYEKLGIIEKIDSYIMAGVKESFDITSAGRCAGELISNINAPNGRRDIRLVSAVCSKGRLTLPTLGKISADTIRVGGSCYAVRLFLTFLANEVKRSGMRHIYIPEPERDEYCEALLFPDTSLSIVRESGGTYDICADDFIAAPCLGVELYKHYADELTSHVTDALVKASENHFELEKIYSAAMNYGVCDRICASLAERCSAMLRD